MPRPMCLVCLEPVTSLDGLKCMDGCNAWVHYSCLDHTVGGDQILHEPFSWTNFRSGEEAHVGVQSDLQETKCDPKCQLESISVQVSNPGPSNKVNKNNICGCVTSKSDLHSKAKFMPTCACAQKKDEPKLNLQSKGKCDPACGLQKNSASKPYLHSKANPDPVRGRQPTSENICECVTPKPDLHCKGKCDPACGVQSSSPSICQCFTPKPVSSACGSKPVSSAYGSKPVSSACGLKPSLLSKAKCDPVCGLRITSSDSCECPKPVPPMHVCPSPVPPTPVCPKSASPKPVCPKSASPKPVLPKSASPKPVLPKSASPKPVLPKSASPKPELPKSASPKPVLPKSASPKPVLPKSASPKPELPKSASPKPVLPKSASPKPVPPRPESPKPVPPKPVSPVPVPPRPVSPKPVPPKPVSPVPVPPRPVSPKPAPLIPVTPKQPIDKKCSDVKVPKLNFDTDKAGPKLTPPVLNTKSAIKVPKDGKTCANQLPKQDGPTSGIKLAYPGTIEQLSQDSSDASFPSIHAMGQMLRGCITNAYSTIGQVTSQLADLVVTIKDAVKEEVAAFGIGADKNNELGGDIQKTDSEPKRFNRKNKCPPSSFQKSQECLSVKIICFHSFHGIHE